MPWPFRPARTAGTTRRQRLRGTPARIVGSGLVGAIVLEALALVLADPAELHWAALAKGWPLPAVHVAAFLLFWAVASAASLLGYLGWLVLGAWRVRTRLR